MARCQEEARKETMNSQEFVRAMETGSAVVMPRAASLVWKARI